MYDVSQVRKLATGATKRFGNGFIAKCNSDNSISLILQKRQAGTRANSPVRTFTIERVQKNDERLKTLVSKANQKALSYSDILAQGKNPKDVSAREKRINATLTMTLKDAMDLYDTDARRHDNNVENTIKKRNSIYRSCVPEWFDKPLADIDTRIIYNKYSEISSGQDGRVRSAQLLFVHLKALFNFLIDTGQWEGVNPTIALKKRIKTKANQATDNFLVPSETIFLIRHIKSFTHLRTNTVQGGINLYRIQQFNIIHFLLLTGLRRSEAFKIERKNIFYKGTELNEDPHFTLTTTKQKEEYAIAITKELKSVLEFQEKLVGGKESKIKNLADLKLTEDKELKFDVKEPKYLFLNEKDLIKAQKRNREWQDKPNTSLDGAFEILNKEIKNLEYAKSITANTLRHTFTTFGHMLGYSDAYLDIMTAHARKNSKVATGAYIARIANTHRKDFEAIQNAMLGKSIKDKDFKERKDNIAKRLEGATEQEILDLYNKGLLTTEEEKQYKVWQIHNKKYKDE